MPARDRPRVLADFAGRWSLEREITPAVGPSASFRGQAVWSPDGNALRYVEEGQMQIEGHAAMQATRSYLWLPDLTVQFDDGRFFHQVPAMGGETGHWCDPDQYAVQYDFSRWPRFEVSWQVHGPRKDYRMLSRYAPEQR